MNYDEHEKRHTDSIELEDSYGTDMRQCCLVMSEPSVGSLWRGSN